MFRAGIIEGIEKVASMTGFKRALEKKTKKELDEMAERVFKRKLRNPGKNIDPLNRVAEAINTRRMISFPVKTGPTWTVGPHGRPWGYPRK